MSIIIPSFPPYFFSLSRCMSTIITASLFFMTDFVSLIFTVFFFLAKKRNRCVARTNGMRVALNNHKNSSRKGRFLMHACEKNIGGIKNYFYVIFLCVAKNTQSRDFFSLSALTGMCRNRNKKKLS